jgi:hypothetical protein
MSNTAKAKHLATTAGYLAKHLAVGAATFAACAADYEDAISLGYIERTSEAFHAYFETWHTAQDQGDRY